MTTTTTTKRKESDVKFIRRMQEKNQDFKIQFEKKKHYRIKKYLDTTTTTTS